MTYNKLFDCERMFRHACAFADCADFAMKEFNPQKINVEWYTTPATVNSAFACEVYLKALLLFYDVPLRKQHKIKELFDRLPSKPQDFVKQKALIDYGGTWDYSVGHELLDSISDAFVAWRYSYETERSLHINIGFLTAFRNALRETCCRQFFGKAWDEYCSN